MRVRSLRHRLLACALACGLGACERAPATWIADLGSTDPWLRRMAVLALASAEDGEAETAFRALVLRLPDRDPEVDAALQASLRTLARRRPDLAARALRAFAAERTGVREFLARLLLEIQAQGGVAELPALQAYIDEELGSGVPVREETVRALLAEFGR